MENNAILSRAQLFEKSAVSWLSRYGYWLLLLIWALCCILYFFIGYEPLTESNNSSRLKSTLSFGVPIGLVLISVGVFIHSSSVPNNPLNHSRFAAILWRFRWAIVLGSTLMVSLARFYFNTIEFTDATEIHGAVYDQDDAKFSLFVGLWLSWMISVFYSFLRHRVLLSCLLLIIPPLTIVFFFYGKKIVNQKTVSNAAKRITHWFNSLLWRNKWAIVLLLTLASVGMYSMIAINSVSLDNTINVRVCIAIALLASIVSATIIALFKTLSDQNYLLALGVFLFPPAAFVFFLYG